MSDNGNMSCVHETNLAYTHRALDREILAADNARSDSNEVLHTGFSAYGLQWHTLHCIHKLVRGEFVPVDCCPDLG